MEGPGKTRDKIVATRGAVYPVAIAPWPLKSPRGAASLELPTSRYIREGNRDGNGAQMDCLSFASDIAPCNCALVHACFMMRGARTQAESKLVPALTTRHPIYEPLLAAGLCRAALPHGAGPCRPRRI